MECIYLGRDFYLKSKTCMSSIYKVEGSGYSRTDWGFIENALQSGITVTIKPATVGEIAIFNTKLEELNRSLDEEDL